MEITVIVKGRAYDLVFADDSENGRHVDIFASDSWVDAFFPPSDLAGKDPKVLLGHAVIYLLCTVASPTTKEV